jgi:putative redox protein
MTIVRHLAHAVGSTGSAVPAYRVDVRAGAHRLVADEPTSVGGGDVGPSPFGLLLGALAACTATTLRMYSARKGWELTTIAVDVRDSLGEDGRRTMERTITVPVDLPAERLEALVAIAERTPVTLAIQGGTPITTMFRTGTASRPRHMA